MKKTISTGVVHKVPADIKKALLEKEKAHIVWEDITPLARNEWLCWIMDAKKEETRNHRLKRMIIELREGKRRPCCWPGCAHRIKNGS